MNRWELDVELHARPYVGLDVRLYTGNDVRLDIGLDMGLLKLVVAMVIVARYAVLRQEHVTIALVKKT